MHEVQTWVGLLPLVAAVSGLGLSYYYYIVSPDLPGKIPCGCFQAACTPCSTTSGISTSSMTPCSSSRRSRIGRFFWKKGDGARDRRSRRRQHRRPCPGHGGRAHAASRAATSTTMPS